MEIRTTTQPENYQNGNIKTESRTKETISFHDSTHTLTFRFVTILPKAPYRTKPISSKKYDELKLNMFPMTFSM